MPKVRPKCKSGHIPYLDANGYLFPCCWIASALELPKLKDFLGDRFEQLDAATHDTTSIMGSDAIRMIEDSWEEGTFSVCAGYCRNREEAETNVFNKDREITITLKSR